MEPCLQYCVFALDSHPYHLPQACLHRGFLIQWWGFALLHVVFERVNPVLWTQERYRLMDELDRLRLLPLQMALDWHHCNRQVKVMQQQRHKVGNAQ